MGCNYLSIPKLQRSKISPRIEKLQMQKCAHVKGFGVHIWIVILVIKYLTCSFSADRMSNHATQHFFDLCLYTLFQAMVAFCGIRCTNGWLTVAQIWAQGPFDTYSSVQFCIVSTIKPGSLDGLILLLMWSMAFSCKTAWQRTPFESLREGKIYYCAQAIWNLSLHEFDNIENKTVSGPISLFH